MNTYSETGDSQFNGGALSAFVVGAAIGAAAALILAPSTGRDTRAFLKRRSNELGRDAMQRGREAWREQSERVKSAIATGWERAESAMHQGGEHDETAYSEARESRQTSDPSAMRPGYRSEPHRSME